MKTLENLFIIYIIISAIHLCVALWRDYFWYKKEVKNTQLIKDYDRSLMALEIVMKQNNELRMKLLNEK